MNDLCLSVLCVEGEQHYDRYRPEAFREVSGNFFNQSFVFMGVRELECFGVHSWSTSVASAWKDTEGYTVRRVSIYEGIGE